VTTASPTSVEVLDIHRNAMRVGSLRRTAHGAVFEYDAAFFEAHRDQPGGLATHLPYSQRVVETSGVNLHTYFAGLLPEGLRLSSLLRKVKTSEDDLFSLLVAAGSDCVGDLFPVLPGAPFEPLAPAEEELSSLDQVSFAELFDRSLGLEHQPSVAGVQQKLSPSMISFPFATRRKRWILKLNPPEYPRLIENEFFFMNAARSCGLRVPKVHLVHDRGGASGLLVERFDRAYDKGRWRGIHQEDACQFLNKYPSDKYRLKMGDIAKAMDLCQAPLVERARLIDLIAFSYVIGNGDLHGKNISLGGERSLQLTPAYDLLTTRPYRDLKLALPFEGRDDEVKRRDFLSFVTRFGLLEKAVATRLDRLCTKLTPFVDRVKEIGLDERLTRQLEELMRSRLANLAEG
jgi:serine/threonine-protein kinase HipA